MSRLWIIGLVAGLTLACGSERPSAKAPAAPPSLAAEAPAGQRTTHASIRATVLESAARIRGGAIEEAPALQAIAQEVADEAAAGRLKWPEVLPALKARVKTRKAVSGAFGVGGTKVLDAKNVDPAQMRHAVDPQKTVLGLGIATGTPMGERDSQHIVLYIAAESLRRFGEDPEHICIGAGHALTADTQCCEGLAPIGCDQPLADGTCAPCTSGQICAACGNGRCGNGETRCNCPADCQ